MKADKAPEKIYIHEASASELTEKLPYHIEYIRKDAFIEKAWEWVDMHFHETEVADRWGESRCVVMSGHDVFKDDLLKDFKKYMKGEGV